MAKRQNWIEDAKGQKPFQKLDILLYALVAALVLVLFWVFVFSRPAVALSGITIQHEQRGQPEVTLLQYDTANGSFTIHPDWQHKVLLEAADDGTNVRLLVGGGDGYNLLHVAADGTAKMLDANCSYHKDCVSFAPINAAGRVIICVPHGITVLGLGDGTAPALPHDDEPMIG